MNRILIVILLSSFVIIFFLGLFIGVYKYFPYYELNNIKDQFESKTFKLDNRPVDYINLDSMISIQNVNDL